MTPTDRCPPPATAEGIRAISEEGGADLAHQLIPSGVVVRL